MFSIFSRLFSPTRRRSNRSFTGQAAVMEPRQMLAATASASVATVPEEHNAAVHQPVIQQIASPFIHIYQPSGELQGMNGRPNVYVVTSPIKGSEVTSFYVYDGTGRNSGQVTLSGRNSRAFEVQLKSTNGTGGRTYTIKIANPRLLPKGARIDLTMTYTSGGEYSTPTIPVVHQIVIVTATAQAIEFNENPQEGQLLGQLPAHLRARRMHYSLVADTDGGTFGNALTVESRGRLVAHPDQDPFSGRSVYDFERRYGGGSLVPSNTQFGSNVRTVENVLVEVYDPLFKRTERVLLNVDLRNVDEATVIHDQSINLGLNGTGGRIGFYDPDAREQFVHVFGDPEFTFSGPFEMEIVAGDSQGMFEITGEGYYRPINAWGSSFGNLKVSKPELLQGRDTFTLRVQLLQRGKLAGEVTVQVKVLPSASEFTTL